MGYVVTFMPASAFGVCMDGTEWNPQAKHTRLANLIGELLGEEKRGVRDVYYALEARGHDYTYDEVQYNISRGRRAGFFDPRDIVDPSRGAVTTPSGVEADPASWLEDRLKSSDSVYGRDFWEDQSTYVEVWLEKRGLASVFQPICNDYNVRLEPTHGDWSDTKAHEAAQRLIGNIQEGKDVRILYFGDYNPSGYRTPVAIQQMMYCYGLPLPKRDPDGEWPESDFYEVSPWDGVPIFFKEADGGWALAGVVESGKPANEGVASFDMERIALTHDQVERFDHLPEHPNPSDADSDKVMLERFKRHVSDGRDTNIELNALKEFERDFLEGLVEEAIGKHVDQEAREAHQQKVAGHKEAIDGAIGWDGDKATVDAGFAVEE